MKIHGLCGQETLYPAVWGVFCEALYSAGRVGLRDRSDCGSVKNSGRQGFPGLTQGLQVLLFQHLAVDAVVNEIPGQDLVQPLFSVYIGVGVDMDFLEGLGPVAIFLVNGDKNLTYPAVSQ